MRADGETTQYCVCPKEGCENKFPAHKHGKIQAQKDGWFFRKNGMYYCPVHVPHELKEWRERKQREKG